MGLPAEKRRYMVEEYLRAERDSRDKHEFHDGEILAMSGGSPTHSLISMNVGSTLRSRLKGKHCKVYDANLWIRITGEARYVYADATVLCGPPLHDPQDTKNETVMNPRVIVEVLSPATERYDRTTKFDLYRLIPSLEEYVLVSQDHPRIEVFHRQSDGSWLFSAADGLGSRVTLSSLGIEVPLAEAFDGVEFAPTVSEPPPAQQVG